MDVKDLCLGALALGDTSGYDIKKLFHQSLNRLHVAGKGSVIPALVGYADAGWMNCQTYFRPPDSRIHTLTFKDRRAISRKPRRHASGIYGQVRIPRGTHYRHISSSAAPNQGPNMPVEGSGELVCEAGRVK